MDHLIALPIKGESFLLKRGSIHVLVDGGGSFRNVPKSGLALAQALNAEFPSLRFIDVVVCTHADGDHAAGLASLLDHWRVRGVNAEEEHGRVGQFWLPGRWADVLPELMREPRVFVNGLIKGLDEIVRDQPELAQSQNADDQLKEQLDALVCPGSDQVTSDEWCPPSRSGPSGDDEVVDKDIDLGSTEPLNDPHWFRQLRDIVAPEKVHDEAIKAFQSARRRIQYRRRKGKIADPLNWFWLELVDTAESIRGIANQAIKYHVRVRWFDFNEFRRTRQPRGGVSNVLVPINAVEQAPQPRLGLGYLLALSRINQECLSFFAPPTCEHLGVLFCGDSPLSDGPSYRNSFLKSTLQPSLPIVVTAPHHGAETNKDAYKHVQNWGAEVVLWLRTGGDKRQPGATFKKIPPNSRCCSHCPQRKLPLKSAGISWVGQTRYFRVPFGHHCVCT